MKLGQVIKFSEKLWVVVMINDCRACIVPLGNRQINDSAAVYDSMEQNATGISPNSELDIVGRVSGTIIKHVPALAVPRVSEPAPTTLRPPEPASRPRKIPIGALPGIPEDMDLLSILTTATQSLFAGVVR